jgi:BMFP domain-containing protein YqiC
MEAKIKRILRKLYGDFNTDLEHQYEDKITKVLTTEDIGLKEEWVTYNQVLLELKNNLRNNLKVEELQYKLTDDTNPADACIEVLESIKFESTELHRLYLKIKNFK